MMLRLFWLELCVKTTVIPRGEYNTLIMVMSCYQLHSFIFTMIVFSGCNGQKIRKNEWTSVLERRRHGQGRRSRGVGEDGVQTGRQDLPHTPLHTPEARQQDTVPATWRSQTIDGALPKGIHRQSRKRLSRVHKEYGEVFYGGLEAWYPRTSLPIRRRQQPEPSVRREHADGGGGLGEELPQAEPWAAGQVGARVRAGARQLWSVLPLHVSAVMMTRCLVRSN